MVGIPCTPANVAILLLYQLALYLAEVVIRILILGSQCGNVSVPDKWKRIPFPFKSRIGTGPSTLAC